MHLWKIYAYTLFFRLKHVNIPQIFPFKILCFGDNKGALFCHSKMTRKATKKSPLLRPQLLGNRLALGMLSSGSRETRWKFKIASFIIKISYIQRTLIWSLVAPNVALGRSRPIHAGNTNGSNPTLRRVSVFFAFFRRFFYGKNSQVMGPDPQPWVSWNTIANFSRKRP